MAQLWFTKKRPCASYSIITPVRGSANLSQFAPKHSNEGEVDLLQSWSEFDLYPLVGTSTIFPWWSEPMLAICNERLAKGLYQKKLPVNPTTLTNLTLHITRWNSATFLEKEKVDLLQLWGYLNPHSLVGKIGWERFCIVVETDV